MIIIDLFRNDENILIEATEAAKTAEEKIKKQENFYTLELTLIEQKFAK